MISPPSRHRSVCPKVIVAVLGAFLTMGTAGRDAEALLRYQYLSSFHLQLGIEHLSNGKTDDALDQFILAVLEDAGNAGARKNLLVIEKKLVSVPAAQRAKLLRFVELAEHVAFLEKRYQSLLARNKTTREFIGERIRWDAGLVQVLARFDADPEFLVRVHSVPPELEAIRSGRLRSLDLFIASLETQKSKLTDAVAKADARCDELAGIESAIRSAAGERPLGPALTRDAKERVRLRQALQAKDLVLASQRRQIKSLHHQLDATQSEFVKIYAELKATNTQMDRLTQQVAGLSLEIYEKDEQVLEKAMMIKRLEQEFLDAKERLNLVQKIIQDKDERISHLEEQVAVLSFSDEGTHNEDRPQAWDKDLSLLQEDLRAQEGRHSETILALKKDVELLEAKYRITHERLAQKEDEARQLIVQLSGTEEKNVRLLMAVRTFNARVSELSGVLEIYRQELAETTRELTDRETRLQEIQKQIELLKRTRGSAEGSS